MKIRVLLTLVILAISFVAIRPTHAQWYEMGYPGSGPIVMSGKNLVIGTWNGVFISRDTGKSWSSPKAGLRGIHVSSMLQKGSLIFAGTDNGIFFSTDEGMTWTQTDTTLSDEVYSIVTIGTDLFASTWHRGVLKSVDNGIHWIQSNTGFGTDSIQVEVLTVKGSILFAGTFYGVFISSDRGSTWSQHNRGFNYVNGYDSTNGREVQYLVTLENKVYVTLSSGSFISTDDGENWVRQDSAPTNGVMSFVSIGKTILGVTNNRILKSTDAGVSWLTIGPSLWWGFIFISSPMLVATNSGLALISTDGGLLASTDSGKSWDYVNNAPIFDVSSFASKGSNLFVATNGGLYRSVQGVSWQVVDQGIPRYIYGSGSLRDTSLTPVYSVAVCGDKVYAGTDTGLFVSSDDGNHWTVIGILCDKVQALGSVGNTILAGGISYYTPPNQNPRNGIKSYLTVSGIFRSTDAGATWTMTHNFLYSRPVQDCGKPELQWCTQDAFVECARQLRGGRCRSAAYPSVQWCTQDVARFHPI